MEIQCGNYSEKHCENTVRRCPVLLHFRNEHVKSIPKTEKNEKKTDVNNISIRDF